MHWLNKTIKYTIALLYYSTIRLCIEINEIKLFNTQFNHCTTVQLDNE